MLSTGLEENLRSQTAKLVEVKQVGEDARLPFARIVLKIDQMEKQFTSAAILWVCSVRKPDSILWKNSMSGPLGWFHTFVS